METKSSNENKIILTPELVSDIIFHNVHFGYCKRVTVFDGLTINITKNKNDSNRWRKWQWQINYTFLITKSLSIAGG